MARTVRFLKDSQVEFSKLFSELCRMKSSWEAWTDFVAMSATTIANAFDQEGPTHDEREQKYINTIKRYSKAEQEIFPKLFAVMVEALEHEPDQDFLGEMFMGLNMGDHWKGQFFTPYNVCRMMSEITVTDLEDRIEKKGWVGINDPCCGAGALLIAARNTMVRHKRGPRDALYVAQDIDRTAALMCYIQLSLLGCAGYVVVGDSLLHPVVGPGGNPLLISPTPEQEIWLMPAFYDEVWAARIQWERMKLVLEDLGVMKPPQEPDQEAPAPEDNPPEAPPIEEPAEPEPVLLNEGAGGQLTLF